MMMVVWVGIAVVLHAAYAQSGSWLKNVSTSAQHPTTNFDVNTLHFLVNMSMRSAEKSFAAPDENKKRQPREIGDGDCEQNCRTEFDSATAECDNKVWRKYYCMKDWNECAGGKRRCKFDNKDGRGETKCSCTPEGLDRPFCYCKDALGECDKFACSAVIGGEQIPIDVECLKKQFSCDFKYKDLCPNAEKLKEQCRKEKQPSLDSCLQSCPTTIIPPDDYENEKCQMEWSSWSTGLFADRDMAKRRRVLRSNNRAMLRTFDDNGHMIIDGSYNTPNMREFIPLPLVSYAKVNMVLYVCQPIEANCTYNGDNEIAFKLGFGKQKCIINTYNKRSDQKVEGNYICRNATWLVSEEWSAKDDSVHNISVDMDQGNKNCKLSVRLISPNIDKCKLQYSEVTVLDATHSPKGSGFVSQTFSITKGTTKTTGSTNTTGHQTGSNDGTNTGESSGNTAGMSSEYGISVSAEAKMGVPLIAEATVKTEVSSKIGFSYNTNTQASSGETHDVSQQDSSTFALSESMAITESETISMTVQVLAGYQQHLEQLVIKCNKVTWKDSNNLRMWSGQYADDSDDDAYQENPKVSRAKDSLMQTANVAVCVKQADLAGRIFAFILLILGLVVFGRFE